MAIRVSEDTLGVLRSEEEDNEAIRKVTMEVDLLNCRYQDYRFPPTVEVWFEAQTNRFTVRENWME